MERVFLEHNIAVISKYYRDINIDSLARRLKIERRALETLLQNMRAEDKLKVQIDHLTNSIIMKTDKDVSLGSREALSTFCNLLDKF